MQQPEQMLLNQVHSLLDEAKAVEIHTIDVRGKTSVTDFMVIVTGTSSRHVKSIAQKVIDALKPQGELLGVEGLDAAEWVLIDLGNVLVHIMQKEVREFYQLEQLWETNAAEKYVAESGFHQSL